jgi:hypothetical protein
MTGPSSSSSSNSSEVIGGPFSTSVGLGAIFTCSVLKVMNGFAGLRSTVSVRLWSCAPAVDSRMKNAAATTQGRKHSRFMSLFLLTIVL